MSKILQQAAATAAAAGDPPVTPVAGIKSLPDPAEHPEINDPLIAEPDAQSDPPPPPPPAPKSQLLYLGKNITLLSATLQPDWLVWDRDDVMATVKAVRRHTGGEHLSEILVTRDPAPGTQPAEQETWSISSVAYYHPKIDRRPVLLCATVE